jgi:hypothetical protein
LDELRGQVAALASEVAELQLTVRHEAGLRAAVDRDQADQGARISATHHLVQAIAITQGQHDDKLTRMEGIMRDVVNLLQEQAGRAVRFEEKIDRLIRKAYNEHGPGRWFQVGDQVYRRSGGRVVLITETAWIEGSDPPRQQFRADGVTGWQHSDEYEMG